MYNGNFEVASLVYIYNVLCMFKNDIFPCGYDRVGQAFYLKNNEFKRNEMSGIEKRSIILKQPKEKNKH